MWYIVPASLESLHLGNPEIPEAGSTIGLYFSMSETTCVAISRKQQLLLLVSLPKPCLGFGVLGVDDVAKLAAAGSMGSWSRLRHPGTSLNVPQCGFSNSKLNPIQNSEY